MDRGYLKLWRKSLDSEVFASESLWRLWSWCLMKTTHKTRHAPMSTGKGEVIVTTNPGQFVFGRNKAASALGWSPSTLWKRMIKLEEIGCISIQSNNQYSIVSICNWDDYQVDETKKEQASDKQVTSKEQPSDSQVTTKELPSDTDKNVKNIKNNKKKEKDIPKTKYGSFSNVLLTDEEFSKLEKLFNGSLSGKIEKLSLYISSTGKAYKSHYATILAWDNRDKEKNLSKKDDHNGFDQRDYQKHATPEQNIPEYLR